MCHCYFCLVYLELRMCFVLSLLQSCFRIYPESSDTDWFMDRVLRIPRELPERLQVVMLQESNLTQHALEIRR